MVMRPALVNVMAKAAEKAGKGLRRDFGEVEHLQVSRKGAADFVSTADMQAQKILREELSKARPAFGFLVEEQDGAPDTSDREERWIIDPLDGTINFLHGVPHFCISIGVERAGEIVAGYIYNPLTDEAFWAEKGLGAFQNDQRLRVSARSDLSECLIGTHLPAKDGAVLLPRAQSMVSSIASQTAGVRMTGSAALSLAYVAAGRFDGFFQEGLKPWDCAAGLVIVKEAGGFVAPVVKGENPVVTGGLIATNVSIHDKLTALLRKSVGL